MKFLGSKTIETDRLVLKAQTMNEQPPVKKRGIFG